MAGLYLSSTMALSGKSAVCIALGLVLKSEGLRVGYMKPLGTTPTEVGGRLTDEDAVLVSRVLELGDPMETVCPALLTPDVYNAILQGKELGIEEEIRRAYARVSADRDVVLMEGTGTISGGYALGLSAVRITEMTDAKAVHILRYRPDLATDNVVMVRSMLGERLVGVIINSVPPEAVEKVKNEYGRFLRKNGMLLFGVLPQDRLLMAISVRELADLLEGEILCCYEHEADLVEAFQVGAMNVDSALRYMMRVPNKAVITGGDRADIQLAALQTSTRALVLTGNLYPDSIILSRATEAGVPIILARTDTMTAINLVEQMMGRIRVSHPKQINRLLELVRQGVDFAALRQSVGI